MIFVALLLLLVLLVACFAELREVRRERDDALAQLYRQNERMARLVAGESARARRCVMEREDFVRSELQRSA